MYIMICILGFVSVTRYIWALYGVACATYSTD